MPIREYQASDPARGCPKCKSPFEVLERPGDQGIDRCPACGVELRRLISASAVGRSATSFDQRAKSAGFHKLKRLGKGEYEKQY